MTKQEEIRKGLKELRLSAWSYDGKISHPHFLSPIDVNNIIKYLDSQGVVIKVESQLLKEEVPCGVPCDKCVAVEPLV